MSDEKPLFLFDWRKKDMNILDDIFILEFLFWKWTNPLTALRDRTTIPRSTANDKQIKVKINQK